MALSAFPMGGMHHQTNEVFRRIVQTRRRLPGLVVFLYRGLFLAGLYLLFYEYLRYQPVVHIAYEYFTHYLTLGLLEMTHGALELMGYDASVQGKVMRIAGTGGVLLDRGCLGRNLLMLFAGFLIIYPGNWKPKLWFIPMGVILIFILNLIRIGGLTIIAYKAPEHLQINHDVFFKYSVYGLTFLLWFIYINKLSRSKKKPS